MKRILLTLAMLLAPTLASAQCNGVFPNNTICGNISGAGNLPRPVSNTALTGVPGGTNGQTQYNNSGNFGGYTPSGDVAVVPSTGVETIQPGVVNTSKIAVSGVSNINLAPGPANSVKGTLNGTTTSDLAIASCSALYNFTQWVSGTGWQCGINPVLPSRAIAAGLNLSAFTSVATLGYTTPGDGGGATYANVGSAGLLDTTPTFTRTNSGTGCTNQAATVEGFVATSSTSIGMGTLSLVTIVGNVVTAAPFSSPGAGYAVGETVVVSPNLPGCSVQPLWTVASVSAATCSFTDTAGNHWQEQIVGNRINALACGVKNDWTGAKGDAGSTNNTVPLQNALWFAYGQGLNTISNHNINQGAIVVLPPKNIMTCAFNLPEGVTLEGAGRYSTNLKDCDSEPAANNFITVGDSALLISCFGSIIRDLGVDPGAQTATPSANTAIVFSNCIQQQTFMERVLTAGGGRSCVNLQVGYGGAEGIGLHDIECGTATATNPGMIINYASAILDMQHIVIETGANLTATGMAISSGSVNLRGFHSEGYTSPILLNVSANNGLSSFHNIGGGAGCTSLVTRQSGSAANVNVIGMATPGGCTNTLNNAGSLTTGNIIADAVF